MQQQTIQQYTIQQQQIWNILYTKRAEALKNVCPASFWNGVKALELKAYQIPDVRELNFWLARQTDWQAVPVQEPLRKRQLFAHWAKRRFPIVTNLRLHPDADLRLQGNTDLFQDVFGKLPWILQPEIADVLERLGKLGQAHKDEQVYEALWRIAARVLGDALFIDEKGNRQLMGARLIANTPEADAALSEGATLEPLVLEEVLAQPYVHGELPTRYFYIRSLSELTAMVDRLEKDGVPVGAVLLEEHAIAV